MVNHLAFILTGFQQIKICAAGFRVKLIYLFIYMCAAHAFSVSKQLDSQ